MLSSLLACVLPCLSVTLPLHDLLIAYAGCQPQSAAEAYQQRY
jgi:hypothetical protein